MPGCYCYLLSLSVLSLFSHLRAPELHPAPRERHFLACDCENVSDVQHTHAHLSHFKPLLQVSRDSSLIDNTDTLYLVYRSEEKTVSTCGHGRTELHSGRRRFAQSVAARRAFNIKICRETTETWHRLLYMFARLLNMLVFPIHICPY